MSTGVGGGRTCEGLVIWGCVEPVMSLEAAVQDGVLFDRPVTYTVCL